MNKVLGYILCFLGLAIIAVGLYVTRDPCDCPIERELVMCPLSIEGDDEVVMRVIEIKVQYHDECCPYYKGEIEFPYMEGDSVYWMEVEQI